MFTDADERFKVIYEQGLVFRCKIIVDRKTGVNYLFSDDGNAGGLSVLVDSEGKPLITRLEW